MARYSLSSQSVTLTAVADATNYTDNGYLCFLQGGGAAQRLLVDEVSVGGESTSSATAILVFARDSTVAATAISGCTNAVTDATTTAPGTVAVFGRVSTTKPQRSSSAHLLQLSINAFGGAYRWQARQGEEFVIYGASATTGECSLSGNTGASGIVSSHILYNVA
jgi:hypothetical protein